MPSPSAAVTQRAGRLGKVVAAVGVVAAMALAVLIFVRPTTVSTGPDQVALHYRDGAFTPRRYEDCVQRSTRAFHASSASRCSASRPATFHTR